QESGEAWGGRHSRNQDVVTQGKETYPSAAVRSDIGPNGGWLGYVRTTRGITGLYLSFAESPDGVTSLVQLDNAGQVVGDNNTPVEFGETIICWVPAGVGRALAICLPTDAGIGPQTRYDQRLVQFASPPVITLLSNSSFVGSPTV